MSILHTYKGKTIDEMNVDELREALIIEWGLYDNLLKRNIKKGLLIDRIEAVINENKD